MKNFRTSYYAYNVACKDEIVYPTATGEIIRLKATDFESEAEFLKWKAFSDEMYHKEQKADNAASNKTVSIDFIEETDIECEDGCDVKMALCEYTQEIQFEVNNLLNVLSVSQKRRLELYIIYKMKKQDIAALEGCSPAAVGQSIAAAKRKIKKYFEKFSKTPLENASKNALSERVNFYKRWLASHPDERDSSDSTLKTE